MKLNRYPKRGCPASEFRADAGAETRERPGGLHADPDSASEAVGLDFGRASRHFDLRTLRVEAPSLHLARVG